jgi:hypothetical protein
MNQLTHDQYDILERALSRSSRVAIRRSNGRELIVIPLTLRTARNREAIDARNPTTGHDLTIYLDEIEAIEALP